MFRVAYNPSLPVVAAHAFTAAGDGFATKQPVDWRALGITERTLFEWWQAGMVSFVEAPQAPVSASEVPLGQSPAAEKRPRRSRQTSPATRQVPRMSLEGGESAKQEDSLPQPAESKAPSSAAAQE